MNFETETERLAKYLLRNMKNIHNDDKHKFKWKASKYFLIRQWNVLRTWKVLIK